MARKRIKRFEQICRHERAPRARRYLKRAGARAMRRAGRRWLDDAPTKLRFLGYTT